MTLMEAVDLIWLRNNRLHGSEDRAWPHLFIGRFIMCATAHFIGAYDRQTMEALTVFADAPLRDVRTELIRLFDEINGTEEVD